MTQEKQVDAASRPAAERVPAGPEVPANYKWKVLSTVIFGIFMIILDTTVVNVAFQTLRQEFGGNLNDSQWIISIYVLALGISTPLAGFLADRFGSKKIYLGGLALFVAGLAAVRALAQPGDADRRARPSRASAAGSPCRWARRCCCRPFRRRSRARRWASSASRRWSRRPSARSWAAGWSTRTCGG